MKTCSFCGEQGDTLIYGKDMNVTICNKCHEKAAEVFSKKSLKSKSEAKGELVKVTPLEIKNMLDEYVIGQDTAKRKLAVSIYNQHKSILASEMGIEVEIDKSNVLLVGPTGSGNIYM